MGCDRMEVYSVTTQAHYDGLLNHARLVIWRHRLIAERGEHRCGTEEERLPH
jgi:hypothetical protein